MIDLDEIRARMQQPVGDPSVDAGELADDVVALVTEVERLRAALGAEREECAKTVERLNIPRWDRERVAAAIRAREKVNDE